MRPGWRELGPPADTEDGRAVVRQDGVHVIRSPAGYWQVMHPPTGAIWWASHRWKHRERAMASVDKRWPLPLVVA